MKEDKKNSLRKKIRNAAMEAGSGNSLESREADVPPADAFEYHTPEADLKENESDICTVTVKEDKQYSRKIQEEEEKEGITDNSEAQPENPFRESTPNPEKTNSKDISESRDLTAKGINENRNLTAKKKEKPIEVKAVKVKPTKVKETKVKPKKVKAERTEKKAVKKAAILILSIALSCLFITTGIVFGTQIVSSLSKDKMVAGSQSNCRDIRIQSSSSKSSVESGDLSVTESNEQKRLNKLAENSRVYCIISSSPYFKDSKSKGSLFISNPKESKYYTQVIIKTKDGKEMYTSPLLAPDEKIEYDYLTNNGFMKGSYDAYAYFNYFSKDGNSKTDADYSYLGSMSAEITVVINK